MQEAKMPEIQMIVSGLQGALHSAGSMTIYAISAVVILSYLFIAIRTILSERDRPRVAVQNELKFWMSSPVTPHDSAKDKSSVVLVRH